MFIYSCTHRYMPIRMPECTYALTYIQVHAPVNMYMIYIPAVRQFDGSIDMPEYRDERLAEWGKKRWMWMNVGPPA